MLIAKKSLGQNFLKNDKILKKIISKAGLQKNDLVLEIGPGKGALTKKILTSGAKIIAIEKDQRMLNFLTEKFKDEIKNKQLKLVFGDALKIDYQKLNLKNQKFKLIANLPYYITGKFLANILSAEIQPSLLLLILQKSVVERIAGKSEGFSHNSQQNFKENLLSLSIKVYGSPQNIMSISAKNFSPAPKVDSALLKVENISKIFFKKNKISEKDFFTFLKKSFAFKRKQLLKNLSNNQADKERLEKIFNKLNIPLNIRAEDLSLEELKNIFLQL